LKFYSFARRLLPSIFQIKPEKTVFLAGRQGVYNSPHLIEHLQRNILSQAGKTSLLYNIHMYRPMGHSKLPATEGFNYEVVTFSQYVYYQFIDPSGNYTMRGLYPIFWRNMKFDFVV